MYTLPKLDYPYDALEPYIDKETMTIHHTKHHQTYINNLNDTLKDHPDLSSVEVGKLLSDLNAIPEEIRTKVVNNGGGVYNHNLFWKFMSPQKSEPGGDLKKEIEKVFGGADEFKEKLTNAALTQFGSGWAWLILGSTGLEVVNTPNQNSPISDGKIPLLGIDVWEHAYYLKYQNKRADYISAWWNVANWDIAGKLFDDHKNEKFV